MSLSVNVRLVPFMLTNFTFLPLKNTTLKGGKDPRKPPFRINPGHFDYFCNMRRLVTTLLLCVLATALAAGYNDHRGHNLDSLERVVARWTPDAVDRASEEQLVQLDRAYRDLMLGYSVINGDKCIFYARKALSISRPRGWMAASSDALRYIGQQFYGREEYDSAMVYYKASLDCVDAMVAGAASPTDPDGYTQNLIDDYYSALYGTIGNLYNVMGDVPQAMEYYGKAGAIFEKYDWNESNSILHYNMGETWLDEGDFKQAASEYERAMDFAQAAGDSLLIVEAWKGFGRLYMEQGKPWKSLPLLRKADAYYAAHPDFSPTFRTENLDFMKEVLSRQKLQLGRLAGVLVALLLVAVGCVLARRRKKTAADAAGTDGTAASGTDDSVSAPGTAAQPAADAPELTGREKEILDLLAKGYTAAEIADALHLSTETIKWYRKKLLVKFDVSNTPELIARAKEAGVI